MRVSVRAGSGFTLVEMLVVITIIAIVAGLTVPLFMSGRVTTRRNDATNTVIAALTAARQAAVEKRAKVSVIFVPNTGDTMRGDYMQLYLFSRDAAPVRLGTPMALPDFVKFDCKPITFAPNLGDIGGSDWTVENGSESQRSIAYAPDGEYYPDITYMPDGTTDDTQGTMMIGLVEVSYSGGNVVKTAHEALGVLYATGLVVRADHRPDPSQPKSPTNPEVKGWL